jgi:hypothetical protein
MEGGELGRLARELDTRFGAETGLTRTGLAPLLEDVEFVEALEEFSVTSVFPRERIVGALMRHLGPLREHQTVQEAAGEVADAIASSMVFAKDEDRSALVFELRRLKAETFSEAEPSLIEDEATGDQRETTWIDALAVPYYLNVPRLLMDPSAHMVSARGEWLKGLTSFRDADGAHVLHAMAMFDRLFKEWDMKAIDVGAFEDVERVPIGARLGFRGNFRTKNLAGRDPSNVTITGDLGQDPHVYLRAGRRKIVVPIDPRWITSMSALIEFSSGRVFLGGLGVLRSLTEERATVAAIALGLPLTPANRWFYEN